MIAEKRKLSYFSFLSWSDLPVLRWAISKHPANNLKSSRSHSTSFAAQATYS